MLTYPEIDPIIFSIGPLAVRWYGMMYVIGFVAGWYLAGLRAKQSWSLLEPDQVDVVPRVADRSLESLF